MIDIGDIRKLLHSELTSLTTNPIYFIKAPTTSVYPFVVYNFTTNPDGESNNIINLDIDVWDDKTDTTVLEDLIKTMNAGLNRSVMSNDDLTIILNLETQLSLDDDEATLSRRQYNYSGNFFEK